jgi:putative ABC transport system permease protein
MGGYLNKLSMLKNYFKIAIRSFLSQKFYSLINTLGLALGTGACLLILLFVQDELSYEQEFENNKQIYRLVQDFPMGTHLSQSATVPFPNKNTMLEDFPEITNAAIIFRPTSWGNTPVIKLDDIEYFEDDFIFAEHSFLEIYNFKFIEGDAQEALKGPNQVILTASKAKKYFGDVSPIGKTINLNNFVDLEVIGVIEDVSSNTHLQFDMIASFETFKSFFAQNPTFFETSWVWVAAWLYFTVPDETVAQKIEAALPEYVNKHYPETLATTGLALHMQKANDIHLNSELELEFKSNSKIEHVYLFSVIAILILAIAIINFMNLATSRSVKRSKEVGIRKVMGAHKSMLVTQFMGEAVLTSLLSMVIAVGLIILAIPWFNNLTGKEIEFDIFNNPLLLIGIPVLGIFTGLLAGSYPALVLSSFQPTDVIKGKVNTKGSKNYLRKTLVVSQFVISISLVICIGIVFKQLNYIENKDMGLDKDQVMLVDVTFNIFPQYQGFKSELEKNHEIQTVSLIGGSIPGKEGVVENAFVDGGHPVEEQQWFSVMSVGHDFEKVLNIELLQGHTFQVGNSADSIGYIINESAARALGWGTDVVGKKIDRVGNGNINQSGTVIGLVKDFHYQPLYNPIKPLVIRLGGNTLAIKLKSKNIKEVVTTIENQWNSQFEGNPFRFTFMDDDFDSLYQKENKFGTTVEYFSILAIFIACLGLLGLSSYTTELRRKEIGIRKVNGASTFSLVSLLSKEFTILIAIAFAISIPVSYYFSDMWLSNFAYRTKIGVDVFIIAGISSLIIALVTVSYHTIKAALSNPITSLRHDG